MEAENYTPIVLLGVDGTASPIKTFLGYIHLSAEIARFEGHHIDGLVHLAAAVHDNAIAMEIHPNGLERARNSIGGDMSTTVN